MINGIIYSVDNPYRLNMFLESWVKHAVDSIHMNIFYSFNNEEFNSGYEKVIKKFGYNTTFQFTKEPKQSIVDYLNNSQNDLTSFFTDEDLFYRNLNKGTEGTINKCFETYKEFLCFSLRLGKNVTVNKQFGSPNTIIPINDISEKHLVVDWSKHYLDFGFPFCVHGHVFQTKEIKKLINKVRWKDLDELQENLQLFDRFPKNKMGCFDKSVIVTDVAPPSATADLLVKKILNIKLLDNNFLPVPIKKDKVDGIIYNFGIYAWLLKDKKNEKQFN